MTDNKDNQNNGNQNRTLNPLDSSMQQPANDQTKPTDRLKDGTNDFANGDQEENSENSTSPVPSSQGN